MSMRNNTMLFNSREVINKLKNNNDYDSQVSKPSLFHWPKIFCD